MEHNTRIPDTDDAWEDGALGRELRHARPAPDIDDRIIDEGLGLKMISIRLSAALIDEFKHIARMHGVGYQTLMRESLTRFARAEMARLARDCAEGIRGKGLKHTPPRRRKAA